MTHRIGLGLVMAALATVAATESRQRRGEAERQGGVRLKPDTTHD